MYFESFGSRSVEIYSVLFGINERRSICSHYVSLSFSEWSGMCYFMAGRLVHWLLSVCVPYSLLSSLHFETAAMKSGGLNGRPDNVSLIDLFNICTECVSGKLLLISPVYWCLNGNYLINSTGYTILKWEKSFNWQDFVVENRKFREDVFFTLNASV